MELFYGMLALVTSAVFWVLLFWERRKAEPHEEIPLGVGPSRKHPWQAHAYVVVAAGLMGLSAPYLSDALGIGGFLLCFIPVLIYGVLLSLHNRKVKRHATAQVPQ